MRVDITYTFWDLVSLDEQKPVAVRDVMQQINLLDASVHPAVSILVKANGVDNVQITVLPLGWGEGAPHPGFFSQHNVHVYNRATADMQGREAWETQRLDSLWLIINGSQWQGRTQKETRDIVEEMINLCVPLWLIDQELWYKYGVDIIRGRSESGADEAQPTDAPS